MKDVIVYNNFIGSVHFSTEDEIFFGKIEGIADLVTFEGESVKKLKKAFEEAVEDYIELCDSTGKAIYKSYKGSFNIRISPELHKKAVEIAQISGLSLNQFVENAIEHEVVNIA